jgi:hypothetical protein
MGHRRQTLQGGSWLGGDQSNGQNFPLLETPQSNHLIAYVACRQACLLNDLIVADMAHLQRKVEVVPVDINDLVQTVAHPTLNFFLGGYLMWDGFKNNLE